MLDTIFYLSILVHTERSSRVLLDRPVHIADINYVGESVSCMYTQWSAYRAVFEQRSFSGKIGGTRRCLRNIRRKSCVPRPERKHTPFSFGKHSRESSSKCLRNSVSPLMLTDTTSGTRYLYTPRLLGNILNVTFVRCGCNLTTCTHFDKCKYIII